MTIETNESDRLVIVGRRHKLELYGMLEEGYPAAVDFITNGEPAKGALLQVEEVRAVRDWLTAILETKPAPKPLKRRVSPATKPKGKVHYSAEAGENERNSERVAVYCGAITVSGTPQLYVREIGIPSAVSCGNCLRNLRKAGKL